MMKSIVSAAFFLRSCLTLSAALLLLQPRVSLGAVIDLTDVTFEHQTQASTGQTTGKWFVKFYAPWCGHCKSLAPIWEELDKRLDPQDGIIVAKVDATVQTQVANRFAIQSYPTLKYFADRKMYRYEGPRDIDSLYEYITGGYKTSTMAEEESIPPPPSAFDAKMREFRLKFESMAEGNEHLKFLLEDFDHILSMRKNAAIVLLVMGSIVGFMFGIIVSLLMGSSGGGGSAPKGQKKKKKE